MLTEIPNAQQPAGEPRRRCFTDAALELFVWYDEADRIVQFQLCYDRGPAEKALTWSRVHGAVHHRVDDGSRSGRYAAKGAPILAEHEPVDMAPLLALFREHGRKLEHDLFEFVQGRLEAASR